MPSDTPKATTLAALRERFERMTLDYEHLAKGYRAESDEMLREAGERYAGFAAEARAIADALRDAERTCEWADDGDGVWQTACGNAFTFHDGSPSDNEQRFCGYCGGTLVEKPYTPDTEEA